MLLKEVQLHNRPNSAAENISKHDTSSSSLTDFFTHFGSVFPQFNTEHDVSHQTHIN